MEGEISTPHGVLISTSALEIHMESERKTYSGPDTDNYAGWNCLLTILGINLLMFILATYMAKCW